MLSRLTLSSQSSTYLFLLALDLKICTTILGCVWSLALFSESGSLCRNGWPGTVVGLLTRCWALWEDGLTVPSGFCCAHSPPVNAIFWFHSHKIFAKGSVTKVTHWSPRCQWLAQLADLTCLPPQVFSRRMTPYLPAPHSPRPLLVKQPWRPQLAGFFFSIF